MKGKSQIAANHSVSLAWAGYTLGFSTGGFFDGILLHQVLQWHHLLSGLQGGRFGDLRFQIMADGLFHILMYAAGGVGLWLLWRSRRELGEPHTDRLVVANALVGFGSWHVVDGIVSHWLLGIHRIKMDSEVPLFWDIVWFMAFGVAFIMWGWWMRRRGPGGTGSGTAPIAMALLALCAGAVSLFPLVRSDNTLTLVAFAPGVSPARAMDAVASVGGRLVWADSNDHVWVVELPGDVKAGGLYREGAIFVSNTYLQIGCLNWFAVGQ